MDTSPDSELWTQIEAQVRECFGRVVYTHKTHEKQADRCATALWRLKMLQILLSSATASGAIAILFSDQFALKVATALVSLVTLIVSGYMKGFDPGEAAQKHRDTAADIWPIRESYLSLLTDIRARAIDAADARHRRDELQGALAAIYKSAPHTSPRAYRDAQGALQKLDDYTFSPGEIDKFLPDTLKQS